MKMAKIDGLLSGSVTHIQGCVIHDHQLHDLVHGLHVLYDLHIFYVLQ